MHALGRIKKTENKSNNKSAREEVMICERPDNCSHYLHQQMCGKITMKFRE